MNHQFHFLSHGGTPSYHPLRNGIFYETIQLLPAMESPKELFTLVARHRQRLGRGQPAAVGAGRGRGDRLGLAVPRRTGTGRLLEGWMKCMENDMDNDFQG